MTRPSVLFACCNLSLILGILRSYEGHGFVSRPFFPTQEALFHSCHSISDRMLLHEEIEETCRQRFRDSKSH